MSSSRFTSLRYRKTIVMVRLAVFLLLSSWSMGARADSGVLIPRDKQAPDPSVLSLAEMKVDILIDNGDARVRITQIFANHTSRIEEGTYVFALPDQSAISDFAVWDGPVRIPAVILERRRAEELYDTARMQAIDPGLLQMGESHGPEEENSSSPAKSLAFSAKIVPIPPWGTKRLELEYHQKLAVTDWKQFFALPLKPNAYHQQRAGQLTIHFEIRSSHNLTDLQMLSKLYPFSVAPTLKETAKEPTEKSFKAFDLSGTFEGKDVALDEDFTATWQLDPAQADALQVLTYRNPNPAQPSVDGPVATSDAGKEPGFFEGQILIGDGAGTKSATAAKDRTARPQTVVLLFDDSLSMQWDKLERSYAALEAVLHTLHATDRFNLILFNQDVAPFQPQPIAADSARVQQALEFVRSSKLRGGTDLGKALSAGLKQCDSDPCKLVLMTDGGSDRGETVLPGKIAAKFKQQWTQSPHHPKTDIFAVGDDANLTLLKLLAQNDGVLEHVLSSEPIEYKLQSFLSRIGRDPVSGLALKAAPDAKTDMIYPLEDTVYPESVASWVGQYTQPKKHVAFSVNGTRDGATLSASTTVDLPVESLDHVQLPRLWAQARVNALLDQIARDGETREAIDEIIRLARRYKLVTPYTSFLAAPRSLLRPRVIRPGDPVLRIRTDPAIESVVASFPFGLTKPLRHLADGDTPGDKGGLLWETRFLAPAEMQDGTYNVRLILRDNKGNLYRESKSFVIASTPPGVKVTLARTQLHKGETFLIKAQASASTRTLTAHFDGLAPVYLHWNPAAALNTGSLTIPADYPTGRCNLSVTAEDIAHNLGSAEVQVEVLP